MAYAQKPWTHDGFHDDGFAHFALSLAAFGIDDGDFADAFVGAENCVENFRQERVSTGIRWVGRNKPNGVCRVGAETTGGVLDSDAEDCLDIEVCKDTQEET